MVNKGRRKGIWGREWKEDENKKLWGKKRRVKEEEWGRAGG